MKRKLHVELSTDISENYPEKEAIKIAGNRGAVGQFEETFWIYLPVPTAGEGRIEFFLEVRVLTKANEILVDLKDAHGTQEERLTKKGVLDETVISREIYEIAYSNLPYHPDWKVTEYDNLFEGDENGS